MTANQLRVRFASDESITDLELAAEAEDQVAACERDEYPWWVLWLMGVEANDQ